MFFYCSVIGMITSDKFSDTGEQLETTSSQETQEPLWIVIYLVDTDPFSFLFGDLIRIFNDSTVICLPFSGC